MLFDPGESEGRAAPGWAARERVRWKRQENQVGRPEIEQTRATREERKGTSCLPGWFNSPSGLAGAGSSLLPQRPEAVRWNPRVTVARAPPVSPRRLAVTPPVARNIRRGDGVHLHHQRASSLLDERSAAATFSPVPPFLPSGPLP